MPAKPKAEGCAEPAEALREEMQGKDERQVSVVRQDLRTEVMRMATKRQRRAGKRLAAAARYCKGLTKGKFKKCLKKRLCKPRRRRRRK